MFIKILFIIEFQKILNMFYSLRFSSFSRFFNLRLKIFFCCLFNKIQFCSTKFCFLWKTKQNFVFLFDKNKVCSTKFWAITKQNKKQNKILFFVFVFVTHEQKTKMTKITKITIIKMVEIKKNIRTLQTHSK